MDQKVAIVTGTSSGLGEAMARTLLLEGYQVLGLSRSEADIVDDNYSHFIVDITIESQVKNFFKELDPEYGIDLLINNAGICEFNSIKDTSSVEFETILKTNVLGHFNILKNFEPFIIQSETHIINILSIASKTVFENSSAYTASKFAFKGLVETLQKEWSTYQLRFSNLYPGAVDTPLWDTLEMDSDRENMLSVDEFLYVFQTCINAPESLSFSDITFIHKNGFVE